MFIVKVQATTKNLHQLKNFFIVFTKEEEKRTKNKIYIMFSSLPELPKHFDNKIAKQCVFMCVLLAIKQHQKN